MLIAPMQPVRPLIFTPLKVVKFIKLASGCLDPQKLALGTIYHAFI